MDITTRKVSLFRTHIDPMIGPVARLAFSMADPLLQAIALEVELTPYGIYAKWLDRRNKDAVHEHLVPFANIQSIKLEPMDEVLFMPRVEGTEEYKNEIGSIVQTGGPTPKRGRPFKSSAV